MQKKLGETFEKETAMCKELHHKQKGCHWGQCSTCGVIPLLYKLHKNIILEQEDDIRKAKEAVFGEEV